METILTGIESFDMEAYRFDLTPFVDKFHQLLMRSDAESSHIDIGLQVITGEGDGALSHDGVWYLDGTLIFYPHDMMDKSSIPSYDSFSRYNHSFSTSCFCTSYWGSNTWL